MNVVHPTRGVLTIAHGDRRYARQAVALARSIRLRDPQITLAVATDFDAAMFEGMFDLIVRWDFSSRPGLISKLDLYAMSPFEQTLFLDADILMYVSVEEVFHRLVGSEFAVIGQNASQPDYFPVIEPIRARVPSTTFPRFFGGLYYFERSERVARIFRHAAEWLPQYDELGIVRIRGQINDEPLFSLALAMEGMTAHGAYASDLLISSSGPGAPVLVADVLAGVCIQGDNSVRLRRAMLHFYDEASNTYAYVLEVERLAAAWRRDDRTVRFAFWVRMHAFLVWLMMPPLGVGKIRVSIVKRLRAMARRIIGYTVRK
jgi:hypothetical protein